MKVLSIVGARPNFMKIDPILRAFDKRPGRFESRLVHSGQHYDDAMSKIFFEELGIRKPDVYLGIGSGSHAEQTAAVMIGVEKLLIQACEATIFDSRQVQPGRLVPVQTGQ